MVKNFLKILLLLVGVVTPLTASFVKEKTKTKKSCNQLKQEAAQELEALLTQTARMIASLAELQEELISKLREIITASADSFFSTAKQSQWYKYCTHLNCLTAEFETQQTVYQQVTHDIRTNFQKG
jgi:Na+-transporting methylmalonyl-CoA/oxaloacetate decarboxylase gamma subunit